MNVLLISRLKTQNAGNEALSKIFIQVFREYMPNDDLFVSDRYPILLSNIFIENFGSDPVEEFDALARKVSSSITVDSELKPDLADPSLVKLDRTGTELRGPIRSLKRRIGMRRRLSAFGLLGKDSARRIVGACKSFDAVVWNAAGEIHPTGSVNEVIRLLLMLRIAQLNGRVTAVMNHSLELHDRRLSEIVRHVYKNMDLVGVRDRRSAHTAAEIGVDPSKIVEIPDFVFLSRIYNENLPLVPTVPETIALAINGLEANSGVDEWPTFASRINRLNRKVLFVSNAMHHDSIFARELMKHIHRSSIFIGQPDYQELRHIFSTCSILISSRLHSSILALEVGIPVVTIEPSMFKLSEVMDRLSWGKKTENLSAPGWSERVANNVDSILNENNRDAQHAKITSAVDEEVRNTREQLQSAFKIIGEILKA